LCFSLSCSFSRLVLYVVFYSYIALLYVNAASYVVINDNGNRSFTYLLTYLLIPNMAAILFWTEQILYNRYA